MKENLTQLIMGDTCQWPSAIYIPNGQIHLFFIIIFLSLIAIVYYNQTPSQGRLFQLDFLTTCEGRHCV
jgi:hypothetical protein